MNEPKNQIYITTFIVIACTALQPHYFPRRNKLIFVYVKDTNRIHIHLLFLLFYSAAAAKDESVVIVFYQLHIYQ